MVDVRAARDADCVYFPEIEGSASLAFAVYPEHAWLADTPVRGADAWRPFVAQGLSFVVEEDSRVIAFIAICNHDGWHHVEELSVRMSAQRRGIGRDLLTRTIEVARNAQARGMTLTTFRTVPWNAPFYTRHGFVIVEEAQAPPHVRRARTHEGALGLDGADRCAMTLILP